MAPPPRSMPTSTAAPTAPQWTWAAPFACCGGMRGRTRLGARRRPARSSATPWSTVRPRSPSTFISGTPGRLTSSRSRCSPNTGVRPMPHGRCGLAKPRKPRGHADRHEQGKAAQRRLDTHPQGQGEGHRQPDLTRRVLPRPGGRRRTADGEDDALPVPSRRSTIDGILAPTTPAATTRRASGAACSAASMGS